MPRQTMRYHLSLAADAAPHDAGTDAPRSRYARRMYFHTRNLELADGVTVQLVSLKQEMHYERIWVGEPNTEDNARFLAKLKEGGAYVVWAPEALTHSAEGPYQYGVRAQLPPIMCTAFVISGPEENTYARLVWFQADWAFPICPGCAHRASHGRLEGRAAGGLRLSREQKKQLAVRRVAARCRLDCESHDISCAAFWVTPHVSHDGANARLRKSPERSRVKQRSPRKRGLHSRQRGVQ